MSYNVVGYTWPACDFGATIDMSFKLTNRTTQTLPATFLKTNDGCRLSYATVSVPSLAPGASTNVTLRTTCIGGTTISNIPSSYTVSVGDQSASFCPTLDRWTGSFEKFGKPTDGARAWNVYLFGLPGSTKSSFINTVATLFSSSAEIAPKAPVGGGGKHCTTQLLRYEIRHNINLWDTWGLAEANFKPEFLELLLRGELPNEFGMEDVAVSYEKPEWRRCHSIVFFLPHGSLGIGNEVHLLKACIQKFKAYNPICVISLVDQVQVEFRKNPEQSYPKLEAFRTSVHQATGIPLYDIFCLANYKDENKRSFELERIAFKVLNRAMINAKEQKKTTSKYSDY